MELSRREVPLYGQARVFVLIPSLAESEEIFVVLEGSSLTHILQTKVHILTYFITPGHNQQETVCVRAYTHARGVLQYVGVSFLKYVVDDAQEMAEYFVNKINQLAPIEYSDLIGRYGLSDSGVRTEMDKKVVLALANLQTNHNLLSHTHESLLHVCVRLGFVHVCEFLLSQPGALMVINLANKEGDTPLQLARQTNQHTLVHLLTHPPNPLITPLAGVSHIHINSSQLLRFIHAFGVMSLSMCVSECMSTPHLHSAILLLRQCAGNSTLIHKDIISFLSDPEDEELLLSISSDGSDIDGAVFNLKSTHMQKVPLKSTTLSMLLCSSSHSSPSLLSNCHKNFTSHRRRSNSESCGHEMVMRKSWSVIGHCVSSSSTPCKVTVPARLDYSAESWSAVVGFEFSHTTDRKTVKRQEVIYELMQTEFHHVQTLTVMNDVLRRGLLEEVQLEQDVIGQIFPCLDDLITLHRNFLKEMESRQRSSTHLSNSKNFIIYRIGDILLQQFSGPSAGHMMAMYGDFCSKQSEALKIYKQLQHSNRKLQLFLRQQSSNSVIKRREIPEFLLLVTQRITKYPILLERLLQHTNGAGVEHDDVMAALEGVRCVLSGVEQHVAKIQRARELEDIISRVDNKSFTRLKNGEIYSKHTLSHTPHTLTHSATLSCRTTSGRLRDVFALLLSDVLIFLQEKEQKFTFAALEQKPAVVHLRALILREIANQDRGLFLISSDATEPEMYEIYTHNREERDKWITLLQHTTDSLPDNDLKNNEEMNYKNIKTLQEALLSLDVKVYAVLEEKLRVCVGTVTHQHLLIQTHTHTPCGATLLTAAQAEVVNLLVCMMSLLFGYHEFVQHAKDLSKKHLKQKEPLILKVVDCVRSLTQILYSLQAAVILQDSVYEVQKILIVEEETLQPDNDGKGENKEGGTEGGASSVGRAISGSERGGGRSGARKKVDPARRETNKERERERMQRKLHLSQLNSTNSQHSLSIIPLDK
ncbi:rho guanine nucleotide exchange factor 28-like isoform X4 [Tachysurus ichikawai]